MRIRLGNTLPSECLDDVTALQWLTSEDEKQAYRAFTDLYVRYQPILSRYFLPFVHDSEELAKEAIQELFVKIWQKRFMLGEISSIEKYLFRSARNVAIDLRRRNQARFRHESASHPHTTCSPTENDLELKEYYRVAIRAIELLPDRRRDIFLLKTQAGRSLDEICTLMGLHKDVVKKQLYLATSFVRDYLRTNGGLVASVLAISFFL